MAGIFAIYKKKELDEKLLDTIKKGASKLRHRGENHRLFEEAKEAKSHVQLGDYQDTDPSWRR